MTTTDKSLQLLSNPLWREQDLGKPIPDSPHAISVALPTWKHVEGYEQGDPEILDAMQGNLCRCITYVRIKKGVRRASEIMGA